MKKSQILTLSGVLMSAGALVSCWHPAFDAELSLSMSTILKMTRVSTIEVAEVYARDLGVGIFMPRRVALPEDGIWFSGWGSADFPFEWTRPLYLSSGYYHEYTGVASEPFSPAPKLPPVVSMASEAVPSIGGKLEAIVFAARKSTLPKGLVRLYTDPSETLEPSRIIHLDMAAPDFGGDDRYVGVGFSVKPGNPAADAGCAVYFDASTNTHKLVEFSYASAMPVLEPAVDIVLPANLDMSSAGFVARHGSSLYLSTYGLDGDPKTYRWLDDDFGTPSALPEITVPLVAVLSDGTLLGSDGSRMTAYGEAGDALYSFLAGPLRFVHERWDGTTGQWIAVFCRTLTIPTKDSGMVTLRFDVFEIPTLQLPSLGEAD